jgi:hypothetical protein
MTTADAFSSVISPWTLDPGESSLFPSYTESSNLLTQTTTSTGILKTLLPGSTTITTSEFEKEGTTTALLSSLWTIASNVTSTAMSPLGEQSATTNETSANGTNSYGSVWTGGPVGGFNEEEEEIEMPVYLRITTLVFLLIIFVVGTVGNSMVILDIHCPKEMQTSTNIFLLNLSLADLLVLLICAPTCIAEVAYDPDVWMLGAAMCKYRGEGFGGNFKIYFWREVL